MKALSNVRTVELAGGAVMPFSAVPGERVRVLSGHVWLTEENKPDDILLESGQEVRLEKRGVAVIEAFDPTRIELIEYTGADGTDQSGDSAPRRSERESWASGASARMESAAFLPMIVGAIALIAVIALQEFGGGAPASGVHEPLTQVSGERSLVKGVEVKTRGAGG